MVNRATSEIDFGEDVCLSARFCGTLSKWTNYVNGWQERYFELDGGVLVYYKSQSDKTFGCRGSITVGCAIVTENEIDDCRFDVAGKDAVWYLRAEDHQARTKWIKTLKHYAYDSGYNTQTDGVSDVSVSSAENALDLRAHRRSASSPQDIDLATKLSELCTCRDILLKQTDAILTTIEQQGNAVVSTTDFRTETLTFRITAAAIVDRLNACIDTLHRRENFLQTSLQKEINKNRQLWDRLNQAEEQFSSNKPSGIAGGTRASSDTTLLSDEEWHDADEKPGNERVDQDVQRTSPPKSPSPGSRAENQSSSSLDTVAISTSHSLFNEVERITMEQLHYAKGVWQLFADEGEMKMYKREVEIDGVVCDPLKAVHSVRGVSAREYIHYFFDARYKSQWDDTLVEMRVVEAISPDTVVLQQLHKRVWPTAQRESLFWSHTRKANSHKDPEAHDLYIVCNKDCERPDTPLWHKSCVRVGLTIAMVCQTVIEQRPSPTTRELSRDDISCNIIYVAQVNPGGWVPSAGLRVVYKREYPRFLKRFTQYVEEQLKGKPLTI